MRDYGTEHPETEALLALAAGDQRTAEAHLEEMSNPDLARLSRTARQLRQLVENTFEGRRNTSHA